MLSRRELLSSAASAAVAMGLPAARAATAAPTNTGAAAKLDVLMDTFFEENLHQAPEGATLLGLDTGKNAALKSKLHDDSSAGRAADKALTSSQLKRLKAIDAKSLSGMDQVNYDTLRYTLESRSTIQSFDFGGSSFGASPYVVSQLTGAYQTVPDFLDTKHKIETAADADAYLSRLKAFAGELDANTARMKHDAGLGVVPPDFLLDTALAQMTAMRVAPDQSVLVTSIAKRAKDKGLSDKYAADAAKIFQEKVLPAFDRLIAETKSLRAHATHDAGVWKFKEGDAFYAAALRSATTTSMSPDAVHQLGLDQAKDISARIDALLKAQGLTQGTVGQRLAALTADPKYLFPNTDAGKADAIAYCNSQLAAIRPKLPSVFSRLPTYSFEVRRVPASLEPGAASAYSQGASLDGSRPGIVYFNLRDSAEWPKFALSTTVFHEGLPGHQLEGSLALTNKDLPLIRKTIGFSGYAEGWALYAEQLADEIGMYDDNPMGRIGYLKFQLFRANRCVVDTGLHHMKWTREQAIQYFVDGGGDAPGFATREVERYCATPGQACSYKIGHTVWTKARERAKTALGAKYDIKAFHAAGLDCGRVPLDVLDGVIDRYIASAK
jgi:uncharacterized protein (DUF885 family)